MAHDESVEMPDEVLVVGAMMGDLSAFDELCARYRTAVVRAAQSVVGRADAEDVAQDALLIAFKALPTLEAPSKFAAWLAAITRHRAFRFTREERAHRAGRVELDEALLAELGALTRPLVEQADKADLRQALDRMPGDYALVLRLHYLDEMPLKRIAAFVGVPLTTVKWRVHQGKKLLREQLEMTVTRG
ncbi:MAG TPA: RNA polymerase sigma factor [Pyrinomonadaceae bacterium]|jgi:RNA polymerase sigma-70 factor (ECF subfamily)